MNNVGHAPTPMRHISAGKPHQWRAWATIAALFLMVFVALGFCSANKGMYLAAISKALNLKRSLFSLNDSFRYISTAVVNLFFGSLLLKFGSKKLICGGFIALIASTLLYTYAEHIALFYLGGILLGVGLSWTTTTMVGSIVHHCFPARAGKIMGFVLASNGIGGALASQIISPLINDPNNAFGYRNAYLLVALILVITLALVFALYKEEKDVQIQARKKRAKTCWEGIPFAVAIKQPYFYIALVCVFLTGMALQSTVGVYSAHMHDVGLDAAYIANNVSVHMLALCAFKFLVGALNDRLGLRIVSLICYIAAVASIFMLATLTATSGGKVMAMGFSVLSSLGLPLETIMLPLMVSKLFGNHSYDKLLGIFISVSAIGYAVGTPITNLSYDMTGTYKPVLLMLSGLMLLMLILFQIMLTMSERHARKV